MNVSLELSHEGISRFETIERLKNDLTKDKMRAELEGKERKASIGISKEQSEADVYSKKTIADGEKKKLEESYERLDGAPAPKTINNSYR